MGPPTYGRSSTQPYQRPLAALENVNKSSSPGESSPQVGLCLVPEFSQQQNTFEVNIKRNSLGLGFSITGGLDAPSPWTNLIRIKKIFPLQPAWETGQLKVGDVILKVSGVPLSSLNLRQALDILRTSPALTTLQVCRVPDHVSGTQRNSPTNSKTRSSVVRSYSYGPYNVNTWQTFKADQDFNYCGIPLSEFTSGSRGLSSTGESMEIEVSPATPEKEWSPGKEEEESNTMNLLQPVVDTLRANKRVVGEFSVTLTKVNGSLGFSLQSSEDNVLNHTIKAILRDPALSDGRLKVGDKLVSANDVDLSTFTHQELIMFLRQCDETVHLGLYRDASRSQTPLDAEPTTDFSRGASPCRKHLRYEAKELVRSLQSSRTSLEKAGLGSQGSYSSGTLGRRRGRPFSPAGHLTKGGQNLSLRGPGSPVPTVESPVTPLNSSAPPSLAVTQAFSGLNLDDRLRIEEVDAAHSFHFTSFRGSSSPNASYSCSPATSPGLYSSATSFHTREVEDPLDRAGSMRVRSIPNSPALPLRDSFANNNHQSRSLPRGVASYFRSDKLCDYPVPRPRELNLTSDLNKRRQGYFFSPSSISNSDQF